MLLVIKRSHFTKNNVGRETNNYGVYELGNSDDILYIDEGQVYTRLIAHYSDESDSTPGTSFYRVERTGGKRA